MTTLMNLTQSNLVGTYVWHFGDNTTATGSRADDTFDKVYTEAGSYTIRLEITSPQGCYKDTVLQDFLTVHPLPVADFSWEPRPTTISNTNINFRNQSFLNYRNDWKYFSITGDSLGFDTIPEPEFEFPFADSGSYPVRLITTTEYGCVDSVTHIVKIDGELIVYTPSAFTPNGDGINDVFRPVVSGFAVTTYELWIFNRWGETIFYTDQYKEGWDGTYLGAIAQSDMYTFRLKVQSAYSAQKKEVLGKVTLLW